MKCNIFEMEEKDIPISEPLSMKGFPESFSYTRLGKHFSVLTEIKWPDSFKKLTKGKQRAILEYIQKYKGLYLEKGKNDRLITHDKEDSVEAVEEMEGLMETIGFE